MRTKTLLLAMVSVSIAACQDTTTTTENTVEGTCEEWTVTGDTMIWPPDHEMHRFTLDACVTITETVCEEPPPPEPFCGDGIVNGTEQCDDGNTNPFDGCDQCVIVDTTPDKRTPTAPVAATPTSSLTTTLTVTSIISSEGGDELSGDGATSDDYAIIDALTFELRAERDGTLDGRTYRVNFVDQDGNTGACTFYVPSSTTTR